MNRLTDLLGQIEEKAKAVNDLFAAERAEAAKDPAYSMPQSDRDKVKSLNREIDELEAKAKELQELEGIRTKAEGRVRDLATPLRPTLPGGAPAAVTFAREKTLGEGFVESPEYKELVESGALESDNARFKTTPFRTGRKAPGDVIGTGTGPGGALVTPQYLPGILGLPQRPLVVRDLFSQDRTDTDTISYAAQTAFDSAAAPVAQATATAGSGLKPQSSIAWVRKTLPVEAIATWMAATRRQLADAGQTRSLIDNQLQLMLRLVEEDQLVNGNGTSPNLRGLLNQTGVQTLDVSGSPSANALLNLDTIRDAKRLVKTGPARADADGVIIHPTDAAIIDERKDEVNRYLGNGPFNMGPNTLWGLPRVESEVIPQGHAIVGAFKVGATVFQREDTTIFASDSHADFFVRNLVAVLAEERLGLAVFFPAAFCYTTFKAWA